MPGLSVKCIAERQREFGKHENKEKKNVKSNGFVSEAIKHISEPMSLLREKIICYGLYVTNFQCRH